MVGSARALLALVIAVVVVHGAAVDDPFHYDDHHSLVNNPAARELGNVAAFFTEPGLFSESPERAMYRPLVLLSYALNAAVAGEHAAAFHVVNLLLHAVASWLVLLLATVLFSPTAGWVAGLLFVVHPLAAEPAIYISARSESLALIFSLLSVLAHRRGRTASSAVLFGLALLAKSTAIVTPGVIWCLARAVPVEGGRPGRLAAWLPQTLVGCAYLLNSGRLISRSLGAGRIRGVGEQICVQLEAWVYQARLLVMPHPLSVEHPLPASPAVGLVDAVVLVAGLSMVAVLMTATARRTLWLSLAAALPLIPPSVIPLNAVISEHRLYSTVALACVAIAGASCWRGGWRRPGVSYLVVLLLLLTLIGWQRQAAWASEVALWRSAVAVAPQNSRAWFFLGDSYRRRDQPGKALAAFARADSLSGGATDVRLSHAGQLLSLDRRAEAQVLLEPLLAAVPRNGAVRYNLGLAVQVRDPRRAERLFEEALGLQPDLLAAAMELALLQDARGAPDLAQKTMELALTTSPTWADGWLNVGFFRMRLGDPQGARRAWTRSLELTPGLPIARDNLRLLDSLEADGRGND